MCGCQETEISCGELYFVTVILINVDDLVKLLAANGDKDLVIKEWKTPNSLKEKKELLANYKRCKRCCKVAKVLAHV